MKPESTTESGKPTCSQIQEEEEIMDLKHIPTLENLACVKISVAIISNPDVANLNFRPRTRDACISKEVFDLLNENISSLTLPAQCRDKIKIITMNMVNEVVTWRIKHSTILNPSLMSVGNLCWTPLGAIDELETAQKLFDRTDLSTKTRLGLACEYCFFQDAITIWGAMSYEDRRIASDSILYYWILNCLSKVKDNKPEINNRNEELLHLFMTFVESRIDKCNIHTFRFILKNKIPAERTQFLRTTASLDNAPAQLRRFCLQNLDEDAQKEVVEKFPDEVLRYFLKWPLQNPFLHLADRIWNKISPDQFCSFIEHVLMNLRSYFWRNFAIVEIFQQLWRRSPENFKTRANQVHFSGVLRILLNCNCLESLKTDVLEKAFCNTKRAKLMKRLMHNFDMDD